MMTRTNAASAAAALLLAGGAIGANIPNDATILETAVAEQQRHLSRTGQYHRTKKAAYETLEYRTPTGEQGFQIIYREGDTTYSIGYGPEAQERTFAITPVASTTK